MAGQQIGVLWKEKEGSPALMRGSIDFMGLRVSVCLFKNESTKENSPPFKIVSFGIE